MDYEHLLSRIYASVDSSAYFTPAQSVPVEQRAAMAMLGELLQQPQLSPEHFRSVARGFVDEGKIDRIRYLSALHVLAAHPKVADWVGAARLIGEHELAVVEAGGPRYDSNMAAVARHRGSLFFLRGRFPQALEAFSKALELERSAENLQNVLCALVRLGELQDAVELLDLIRSSYPGGVVEELERVIALDPDLALLREE